MHLSDFQDGLASALLPAPGANAPPRRDGEQRACGRLGRLTPPVVVWASEIVEQELERLIARVEAIGERGLFVRCEGEVADVLGVADEEIGEAPADQPVPAAELLKHAEAYRADAGVTR